MWIKQRLISLLDRAGVMLGPEWCHTTLLAWGVCVFMILSVSNAIRGCPISGPSHPPTRCKAVYYLKLLHTGSGDSTPKSFQDTLGDVVIFTLSRCPGALVRRFSFTLRARLTDART